MPASLTYIELALNRGLNRGNPLCVSATDITPQDYAELIESDQLFLRLRFQLPGAAQGAAPQNLQLASGTTLVFAGKAVDDLDDTSVLFLATSFTEQQDASGLYYYEAFLNLNSTEIAAAFASLGDDTNTLSCLADVEVCLPAEDATPALRHTSQIAINLKRQVYSGTESTPTPATPTYPPPDTVDTIAARNTAIAAATPAASQSVAGIVIQASDFDMTDFPDSAEFVSPRQVALAQSLPPCATIDVLGAPYDGCTLSLVFPYDGVCQRFSLCYAGSSTMSGAPHTVIPMGQATPYIITLTLSGLGFTNGAAGISNEEVGNVEILADASLDSSGSYYDAYAQVIHIGVSDAPSLNTVASLIGALLVNSPFPLSDGNPAAVTLVSTNPSGDSIVITIADSAGIDWPYSVTSDTGLAIAVTQVGNVASPSVSDVMSALESGLTGCTIVPVSGSRLALYPTAPGRQHQFWGRMVSDFTGSIIFGGQTPPPWTYQQAGGSGDIFVTLPGVEQGDLPVVSMGYFDSDSSFPPVGAWIYDPDIVQVYVPGYNPANIALIVHPVFAAPSY